LADRSDEVGNEKRAGFALSQNIFSVGFQLRSSKYLIANRFKPFLVQVIKLTMVNINILANSWKHHYEQHPLKHQSNAKLTDIVTIFYHDETSNNGVADFCNSNDVCGLGCARLCPE
jgi:hypothetical protein